MSAAAAERGAAPRVVAVIVTYNRRELLLESLAALDAQTRVPDAVVVVDNASDDGTADAVREQHGEVRLVRLPTNTGGAGGFAAGLSIALGDGADLVWLMDDDTVPERAALAELLRVRAAHPGRPVLLASRVVWTDGRDHPMNTPRAKPLAGRRERRAAAALGCLPIRSASFVSVLVDADTCRERGLPIADYFLWNDDFEFTTRILRGKLGLYCPSSVVVHKTAKFGSTDVDPGPRFYYEVRNKVWMLTRSRSLGPLDRALYTGSTLRRWLRLLQRSHDRRVLLRALRRGLADGLRRAPRPTAQVLADAGLGQPPDPGRALSSR